MRPKFLYVTNMLYNSNKRNPPRAGLVSSRLDELKAFKYEINNYKTCNKDDEEWLSPCPYMGIGTTSKCWTNFVLACGNLLMQKYTHNRYTRRQKFCPHNLIPVKLHLIFI